MGSFAAVYSLTLSVGLSGYSSGSNGEEAILLMLRKYKADLFPAFCTVCGRGGSSFYWFRREIPETVRSFGTVRFRVETADLAEWCDRFSAGDYSRQR